MIAGTELRKIARERLADANALFESGRYDGAIYLCGYAVEISLKYRICKTLRWAGYPDTRAEFERYQSFRTHDLRVLLHLSGREAKIKASMFTEWSTVAAWDPAARYESGGEASEAKAERMLEAAAVLVRAL